MYVMMMSFINRKIWLTTQDTKRGEGFPNGDIHIFDLQLVKGIIVINIKEIFSTMSSQKDILVLTTSTVNTLTIKQYLKPVSAHIVAGTNFFSDFFASFSDVFGGRSGAYQRQLTSLYNEAIERVKQAAYEIGANCVIGLTVDMDEISGKGKSMFMLTALGTAVIIDKATENRQIQTSEKFVNASAEKIKILKNKKTAIEKANRGELILNEEMWRFLTDNQVDEIFPFLIKKFKNAFEQVVTYPDAVDKFYKNFVSYVDGLPETIKLNLLYTAIQTVETNELANKLCDIIIELQLLDFDQLNALLKNSDFRSQKRSLPIIAADKPFYNKQDLQELSAISEYIKSTFTERGARTRKKQLLSSKEKEMWICECGKTNDIGSYCGGCGQDIYGFNSTEAKPQKLVDYIEQKIGLISELLS